MIHRWFEPFKEWFGYSRRERRATFILLILIIAVAGARFVFPEHKITIEKINPAYPENHTGSSAENKISPDAVIRVKPSVAKKTVRKIELNSCDSASLESLPGIGPVLSARIIKYRNLLGGYASVVQLREVYGLTEDTYSIISGRLTADTSAIRKIKINSADYKQLIKLPYFEKEEVSAILKYREMNGRFESINELVGNNLISREKAAKVRAYLVFGE
jgi:DNA uptake protein ComE-like DNA-binding protein